LRELESLVGRKFEKLHIVGGGSRSQLLNQLTADATGLKVIAGPVEATALGNVLIQAVALKQLDPGQIRRVVEKSFSPQIFLPGEGFSKEVHARFETLHPKKS